MSQKIWFTIIYHECATFPRKDAMTMIEFALSRRWFGDMIGDCWIDNLLFPFIFYHWILRFGISRFPFFLLSHVSLFLRANTFGVMRLSPRILDIRRQPDSNRCYNINYIRHRAVFSTNFRTWICDLSVM